MPPITFQYLANGTEDTDDTAQDLTVDPVTSGAPLWAFAASRYSAAPVEPTLAGTNGVGGTWTNRGTVTVGTIRVTMFSSTAASGVSGTLTATYADSQLSKTMAVVEGLNCGSAVPVQVVTDAESSVTSINLDTPLASFANANNATLICVVNSLTFGSNFSGNADGLFRFTTAGLGSGEAGGPSMALYFFPGAKLSPNLTFSSSDALLLCAEIDHDGTDLGGGATRLVGGVLAG